MTLDELKTLTLSRFSLPPETILELRPILKGGSDRSFWRGVIPVLGPSIVMHYSAERQENAGYAAIASLLKRGGVAVPAIHGHDTDNRVVWAEDLGENDLHALNVRPWEERRPWYQQALVQTCTLHSCNATTHTQQGVHLMPGFDAVLYAWERNYFFERFVHGACKIELSAELKTKLDFELEALANHLCNLQKVYVHRDLQSQNIMLKEGGAWFIDFQGMREGTRFYDLGSLLYDPYVPFTPEQRLECARYYYDLGATEGMEWAVFAENFHAAAAQRLMQALGAYGFLGIVKGKSEFLHHIPAGLRNLQEAAHASGILPHLVELTERLSLISLPNQG